jgi:HEAT repeat protein
MGFKADSSFLRFLSMGAMGVRQTMRQLTGMGFRPIELERYCASNKIWATKVKRLRLPDLLCVRTGLRIEVRAKTDLKIRMSDAPNNPDRTWDAGNRDEDLAAFIAVMDSESGPRPHERAEFFTFGALRASVAASALGTPKSASEGAERDRTWPSVVPSGNGTVQSVNAEKLIVAMDRAGGGERRQTYTLRGKNTYVQPGERFFGEACILAGAPAAKADLHSYLNQTYDPIAGLQNAAAVDRYAAVKSLPYREDLRANAVQPLENLLSREPEERVALEAAGASAALGSDRGQDYIGDVLRGNGRPDLRMEAVLILTELRSPFSRTELIAVANDPRFADDEIRQAAIWGLGKAGLKNYDQLLPFIADPNEDVAMHAIVAFGADTPESTVRLLVADLTGADPRRAPAASEALRLISNDAVLSSLIEASTQESEWVLATLGRLPARLVRPAIATNERLMRRVSPMLLLGEGANWLANEDRVIDIGFLAKQDL